MSEKEEIKIEEPKKKASSKNPFKSKKFKHGSLSVVFTVFFIVAVILVNVILNLVLERFNVSADLTTGSIFTLGDETQDYIKGVNDDIAFYVTANKDDLKSSGQELYEQVVEFLDKMVSLNAKFSVNYVNLLTDPDFSNDYTEDLNNYQIIVKSGKTGRYRILNINNFLRFTLNDGNTYPYSEAIMYVNYGGYTVTNSSSVAEQEIVSAVMAVSKENPTVVTFLTGYGESDSKTLTEILTANAYVTETAEIERIEKIPEETDILVIHGPKNDYSLESINKIDLWLSNGGKYGKDLIYISTADAAVTPNLDEFLAEWGLKIGKGYILQFNTDHAYYTGSALPLMQDLKLNEDGEYYKNMKIASNTTFVGYYARPVIKLWDEESNMANTVIASAYGDQCLLYPFDADENWKPTESDFNSYDVIVEASKVQYEGTDAHYSKIIAAGSDQLFISYFTGASNYNNAEVALSLFDTNTENTDGGITIIEKSFTAETYQLDQSQQTGIGLTFAVIIPVIIIIIGIVVWVRRKHL